MAEGDTFPVDEGAASGPDEPGTGVKCPECSKPFTGDYANLKLGAHRFRVHGVRGQHADKNKSKGSRKRRSDSGTTRAPSTGVTLRSVEKSLAESATKLGALTYPVLPIPSLYLTGTADEFAATVARIASRNPKLLERLQGTSDAMDYLALGTWVAGLAIAVGVQLGRIPVGSTDEPNPIVSAWGIDKMYAQAARDFAVEDDWSGHGPGADEEPVGNGPGPAAGLVDASP